jgi:hypothetical protein
MEFEALLLGIEPLTALAVGLSAVVLAPVISVVGGVVGKDKNLSESLGETTKNISESARGAFKETLIWGFGTFENAQVVFAEAEESFRDLVADAKTEYTVKKSTSEQVDPREVEIVSE